MWVFNRYRFFILFRGYHKPRFLCGSLVNINFVFNHDRQKHVILSEFLVVIDFTFCCGYYKAQYFMWLFNQFVLF